MKMLKIITTTIISASQFKHINMNLFLSKKKGFVKIPLNIYTFNSPLLLLNLIKKSSPLSQTNKQTFYMKTKNHTA